MNWLQKPYGRLGSSDIIVSDYRLDGRGSIPGRGKDYSSILCVQTTLRPIQPPIQWLPGGLFPGGKARLVCDADHSPPSNAEVKNE
jgi:hypothetical protein